MKFIETGTTWLIVDQLDDQIVNSIKSFLDKNISLMYRDEKQYSTSGKNSKQYWIKKFNNSVYNYSTSELEILKKRYKEEVLKILRKINILNDNIDLNETSCWTVIGGKGSYHTIHNHGCGYSGIVTVLYLEVPDISSDEDGNDNAYFVMHTNPHNHSINESFPSFLHIDPKPGKILIFPHHVPHGTYPQTKGIRQTFNMDYMFEYKSNNNINYI